MEFSQVVGLDPSLTSTGIAAVNKKNKIIVTSVGYPGRKTFTLKDQIERVEYISQTFGDYVDANTLVVIEAPSYSSVGGLIWTRAGLWTSLVQTAYSKGAIVAECAPKVRPRWACGNGNAAKGDVLEMAKNIFPHTHFKNDDEGDSAILAAIGMHYLGWRDFGSKIRNDCLLKVKWNDTIETIEKEEVE